MNEVCRKIYEIVKNNDFHLRNLQYSSENYWLFSYGGSDNLHIFKLKDNRIIGILEEYANPVGADERILNIAKNENFRKFFDLFYKENDYLPEDVRDILEAILNDEYYLFTEESEKEKNIWIYETYQNYKEKIIGSVLYNDLSEIEITTDVIEDLTEEAAEKVVDILNDNDLFPLFITRDNVLKLLAEEIKNDLKAALT